MRLSVKGYTLEAMPSGSAKNISSEEAARIMYVSVLTLLARRRTCRALFVIRLQSEIMSVNAKSISVWGVVMRNAAKGRARPEAILCGG